MAKQINTSPMEFPEQGVWSLISKEDLLFDLRRSLEHPETAKKQALPGAEVIAKLIQKNPQEYIRIIQSLWQTGSVCFRRQCVQAPAWVKAAQPPKDVRVDVWMVLVSLNGKIILETAPPWQQWLRRHLYNAHVSLFL